ncbi:hypothetical protein BN59_01430 [Legionella massiliensis]|uniref:Uncharacterized protein n=1 Tax=Legionella massiliensis TaxID=1034943 RepID=A0A078KZH1_9GAMM|nr:hypothetical protein BN59_01430 [Legionella massiliensis]CEE12886.1 hypothetical protein BN1094_01430 [Legionella massiliensis]
MSDGVRHLLNAKSSLTMCAMTLGVAGYIRDSNDVTGWAFSLEIDFFCTMLP